MPQSDPTCGHCGYCVRGITTLTCPECGSDLREVGIVAPNMRIPISKHARAAIWTLALPPAAFLISWLLMSTVLPYSIKHKMSRQIVCNAPYLKITLDVFTDDWPWQPGLMGRTPFYPDHFRVTDNKFTGLLEAHLSSGAYHYWWRNSPMTWQNAGFNGAAIANWLSGNGVNPADPKVLRACDEIYRALNDMHLNKAQAAMPLTDANGAQIGTAQAATSWSVRDEPNPVMIFILGIVWLIIWIYCLRRIYRHRATAPAQMP